MSDGFASRRALLLEEGTEPDIYGGGALFALARGGGPAEANAALRRAAAWFDLPHPHGRDPRGEPDFAAIKLARAWHLFGDALEPKTREAVARFFLRHDFASMYQSENHALLFHSARHLMGAALPGEAFVAYGKDGAALRDEDAAWLRRFLHYRFGYGWGEFDSPAYLAPVWESLACLHDFSPGPFLRRAAGTAMDQLLADMEADSLGGAYGGAHGRIYPAQAHDHAAGASFLLRHLYFGGERPARVGERGFLIDALTSGYRPHPLLDRIAGGCRVPYENRERKHLHNVADVLPAEPLPGSIRKYTYRTPSYVMGCVQFQDPYPAPAACPCHPHHEGAPVPPEQRSTAGYAWHQQHQWDLSFATRSDARLFAHHPGADPSHNDWTGDRLCGCGHFFQNRSALAALYAIPPGQPRQYIHAWVPRAAFDEVVEEGPLLFVRAGAAFAALRFSGPWRWTGEGEWAGREVVSDGPLHGMACEAGTEAEFGGFAAFRREVAANPFHFDPAAPSLEYRSARAGTLRLDARGGRWLDGRPADLEYPAHDSPFLRTAWGAASSTLEWEGETAALAFPEEAA